MVATTNPEEIQLNRGENENKDIGPVRTTTNSRTNMPREAENTYRTVYTGAGTHTMEGVVRRRI